MKMKVLFVVLISMSPVADCIAQNEILLMKPGDSIPGVVLLTKRDDYYGKYQYTIPTVPQELKAAIPLKVNYRKAANYALNRFQLHHVEHHYIDIGRSFLDCTNSGFSDAVEPPEDERDPDVKESMKKILFGNRLLREMIYNWMMPVYQKAFAMMSVPEQQDYIGQFNQALTYIANFNMERETDVVNDSYNYATDVGSLNAFIYRRTQTTN